MPFRAVPSDQIPQELRDVCERFGFRLHAADVPPAAGAPSIPSSDAGVAEVTAYEGGDATSIASNSTDSEPELVIRITRPSSSSGE
jgi:hypothetical protein